MTTEPALAHTRLTIETYERYAETYATLIDPHPPAPLEAALRRMVDAVPANGTVLEVGSGVGRDADFVESLGLTVRRTDATKAFIDMQAERGKKVEPLNLITDNLGGPYDAVLAMAVLIHIDRDQTDSVLRKIAAALWPEGVFLVLVREGTGETTDNTHMVYWSQTDFGDRLAAAGLRVEWEDRRVAEDEVWLSYLARKVATP